MKFIQARTPRNWRDEEMFRFCIYTEKTFDEDSFRYRITGTFPAHPTQWWYPGEVCFTYEAP